MNHKFSMRYIAWQAATGLLDGQMYLEAWEGICRLSFALIAFVIRLVMLVTFPISVPLLWGFLRVMEPINQRRRKARHEKNVEAYRQRSEEAE